MKGKVNFFPKSRTLQRFRLFERKTEFILLGGDKLKREFYVLTIDKMWSNFEHNLASILHEEDKVYTTSEINARLKELQSLENIAFICKAVGVLGFIKFNQGYYLWLITEKEKVAKIGAFNIHTVCNTKLIQMFTWAPSIKNTKKELKCAKETEKKYMKLLKQLDLSNKQFFFSYNYDLTHTLQENILLSLKVEENREKDKNKSSEPTTPKVHSEFMSPESKSQTTSPEERQTDTFRTCKSSVYKNKKVKELEMHHFYPWKEGFVWNHYLLIEFRVVIKNKGWLTPLIHGYIGQANCDCNSGDFNVILIGRRSRHFAGTRYLKRGLNERGKVANFVETEQIVYSTSLALANRPSMSSYVQIRGSIPLFWTQEANPINPKPAIILNDTDISFKATKRHIGDLLSNYGAPIQIVNLTKQNRLRETKITERFKQAVEYANEDIKEYMQVDFDHFDVKAQKKFLNHILYGNRNPNFMGICSNEVMPRINRTGLFCCTAELKNGEECSIRIQNGVIRTNCIDCIDRTNWLQRVIGILVLAKQLHELGIKKNSNTYMQSQIGKMIGALYVQMGDIISLQYGGSGAHKDVVSKKKNPFGKVPELFTSIKRHISNVFDDYSRQDSHNLFLGLYKPEKKKEHIWEMQTDISLHHCQEDLLPEISEKWGNFYFSKFLNSLPKEINDNYTESLNIKKNKIGLKKTVSEEIMTMKLGRKKQLSRPKGFSLELDNKEEIPSLEEEVLLLQKIMENEQDLRTQSLSLNNISEFEGKEGVGSNKDPIPPKLSSSNKLKNVKHKGRMKIWEESIEQYPSFLGHVQGDKAIRNLQKLDAIMELENTTQVTSFDTIFKKKVNKRTEIMHLNGLPVTKTHNDASSNLELKCEENIYMDMDKQQEETVYQTMDIMERSLFSNYYSLHDNLYEYLKMPLEEPTKGYFPIIELEYQHSTKTIIDYSTGSRVFDQTDDDEYLLDQDLYYDYVNFKPEPLNSTNLQEYVLAKYNDVYEQKRNKGGDKEKWDNINSSMEEKKRRKSEPKIEKNEGEKESQYSGNYYKYARLGERSIEKEKIIVQSYFDHI